ncbi:MAG TPA: tyrosine--tRNA ligase, partial [Pyrinomonadaceae bacterium]|nr:tyrosine--tRNA ligase [Pyrinomonadaceae bacterium]
PQVVITMPLLEGTDGVRKMSKSYGNYVGIDEPPAEMFGKLMSISDELMWRYYELLTDLRVEEINRLRESASRGERNPRDLKAELAEGIIADFHSPSAARAAREEFDRRFRHKEAPDDVEERSLAAGTWKLARLLVETSLAPSMAEARRLIEQGGVRLEGERATQTDAELELTADRALLLQVGKRRFLRVRGE